MTKRISLALLACLVLPTVALGQDPMRGMDTRYGFRLGVAFHQVRDEVLANLRHQGPKITAGLFREGISDSGMHRIDLSFSFAPLTDRYSPDRSSILFHPALELRYAKRAVEIGQDMVLYLGGAVGWNTRFSFFENWDRGHPYWLTSTHLGVAGALVRSLDNGNAIRFELDAPFLAVVSRPPERFDYKEVNPDLGWVFRHIHEDLRVTSLHEHTAVTATVAYERRGGGLLGQRFFWQTSYTSTRLPHSRPVTVLSHTVGISHPF